MTEQVNHPAHYGGENNPYEVIKVIEAWGLGFHLGNAIKYIGRAGKKAGAPLVEDISKAIWYCARKIQGRGAAWVTSCHYDRVREFMEHAQQEVKDSPEIPSMDVRELRARLVLEEALELVEALGFKVCPEGNPITWLKIEELRFDPACNPDLVGIADGCADLSVVNTGTMIACGIRDLGLLDIVDENNLAKFGPGGYRREDGKWVKSPNHQPPDIEGLLKHQQHHGED